VGHDARARAALEPAPTTGAIDIVDEPRLASSETAANPAGVGAGGTFAISAASVYACFAWLPVVLVDIAGSTTPRRARCCRCSARWGCRGRSSCRSPITRWNRVGGLRRRARRGVAGVLGMVLAPTAATVLWVVLLGTPQGSSRRCS
jgi:CP family cyanate transporter-like MFS transporter